MYDRGDDVDVRKSVGRCPYVTTTGVCVCVCVYVFIYGFVYIRVCVCVYVCRDTAVIYYTCTCQSIGTEEELKRKEMKL